MRLPVSRTILDVRTISVNRLHMCMLYHSPIMKTIVNRKRQQAFVAAVAGAPQPAACRIGTGSVKDMRRTISVMPRWLLPPGEHTIDPAQFACRDRPAGQADTARGAEENEKGKKS